MIMEMDQLGLFDEPSKLEKQFLKFHLANPHVYQLLVSFAREWRLKGKGKLGMAMLFEHARWVTCTQTTADDYVLNNNHRAFYARLIMRREPDLNGLFNLREQRTACFL